MEILSLNNARIKQFCKYHEKKTREIDQRFLVENEHLIQEAIQANQLETLILPIGSSYPFDGEILFVTPEILNKLKMNVSAPSMVGVCKMKKAQAIQNRVILLDDVQDPGNVGTIIRSAYSFGFDSVVLSNKCADLYNDKVVRSTQGALFHMNVVRGNLIDFVKQCQSNAIPVYATTLEEADGLASFENPKKLALVFGNEGEGVSQVIQAMADQRIFIEMNQFESLNVAVAAGICCYWFRSLE